MALLRLYCILSAILSRLSPSVMLSGISSFILINGITWIIKGLSGGTIVPVGYYVSLTYDEFLSTHISIL